MKKSILLSALIAFTFCSLAQQCSNCKQIPKVARYDLDIQVPQPKLQGQQTVGWLEWTRLFEIIGKINAALKQSAGNCIIFTQPNDARLSSESFTTKDGIEVPPLTEESDQLKVGLYYTNLPPAGDVSRFGDYITTGYVRAQGNAFIMQIEIQTACERKVVAKATVLFDSLKNSDMTLAVANQAAAQLSPLSEKIKKYELDERQKDRTQSLFKMEGDPIKITPLKTTLKAGESTDFTIELKDCDNVPLHGREILFTETEYGGLKIFGTMGGTVTPAKVVTDANGKATARFTLKAGAKEAIINAHSPGNDVKGCSSMFTGDASINIRKTYSGHVTFTYSSSGICNTESTGGCLKSTLNSNHDMGITYKAVFYDDGSKQDKSVQFSTEEETSLVPRTMETASYAQRKFQISQGEIVCESVGKGDRTVQKIQSVSEGKLKSGNFSFSFGDAGSGSVSVDMVFTATTASSFEQTHLQSSKGSIIEDIGWQFSAMEGFDKDFVFKKESAGGKIKYTVSGTRTFTANSACGGQSTSETIKAVVVEE